MFWENLFPHPLANPSPRTLLSLRPSTDGSLCWESLNSPGAGLERTAALLEVTGEHTVLRNDFTAAPNCILHYSLLASPGTRCFLLYLAAINFPQLNFKLLTILFVLISQTLRGESAQHWLSSCVLPLVKPAMTPQCSSRFTSQKAL